MAKAVAALNPQLFQHMNFQKEKDYYKVYMHINRNVFAEYQKMKKLNESEESDQCVRIYVEGLQTPINKCWDKPRFTSDTMET